MFNNSDKFDHMIALAAMKCAEEDARALNELDTEGVSFDASYYRKRNRVINKCKRRSTVKLGKRFWTKSCRKNLGRLAAQTGSRLAASGTGG